MFCKLYITYYIFCDIYPVKYMLQNSLICCSLRVRHVDDVLDMLCLYTIIFISFLIAIIYVECVEYQFNSSTMGLC